VEEYCAMVTRPEWELQEFFSSFPGLQELLVKSLG
jgi:hypothetical protein